MPKNNLRLTRREFFRLAGASGLASVVTPLQQPARASQAVTNIDLPLVPRRPFGNTGEMVSSLALGGSQDLMSKQMLLKQAFTFGVTYWDTAYS